MSQKFNKKPFRLSNKNVYALGLASRLTGAPESVIANECAELCIAMATPDAVMQDASRKADAAAFQVAQALKLLKDTGKFPKPHSFRLAPEVAHNIGNAAKDGHLNETTIFEHFLERAMPLVVANIIKRKESMADPRTSRFLLRALDAAGLRPSGYPNSWERKMRGGRVGVRSTEALKTTHHQLSAVASGRMEVPGIGRVTTSGGRSSATGSNGENEKAQVARRK